MLPEVHKPATAPHDTCIPILHGLDFVRLPYFAEERRLQIPMEGRLSGSTAIVTGASAGIGEVIVKTFAHGGASVAIVNRNLQEANGH